MAMMAGTAVAALTTTGQRHRRLRAGGLAFVVAVCALGALLVLGWFALPSAAQEQSRGAAPATVGTGTAPATGGNGGPVTATGPSSSGTGTSTAAAAARPRSGSTASVATNIGLVLFLTLVNALFSMAETALVSVRRSRVEQLVEEGSRSARVVKRLVENPPRFIATTQVGITLLGFASAAAAATTLAEPLVAPLEGLGLSPRVAEGSAVGLVTVLIAFVSMVLGEIAPKSLAIQAPDAWALRLAPLIDLCATLFAPLTWLVIKVSGLIVRPFGAKAQFESPVVTKEELEHIISEGEEHGELDEDEQQMLHNVFDLTETPVRKVMTPRRDMTLVSVDADLPNVLQTIIDSGHSRLPVYEGNYDKIVGMVHAKDLLPILGHDEQSLDLRRVMRAAKTVPEGKSVMELLTEFRRSNQQVAIVKDEYDGTEGIVTIEDLLEEIVGDIKDEYDVDEPDIVAISATESHIDGRLSIDDVNEQLNIALPTSDEYDSISGFVFSQLGREPLPGDRVRYENMEFIVEQVEGIYIRTLRAIRLADLDADGNAAPSATAGPDADDGSPLVLGGAPTGAMTVISSATGDEIAAAPGLSPQRGQESS